MAVAQLRKCGHPEKNVLDGPDRVVSCEDGSHGLPVGVSATNAVVARFKRV